MSIRCLDWIAMGGAIALAGVIGFGVGGTVAERLNAPDVIDLTGGSPYHAEIVVSGVPATEDLTVALAALLVFLDSLSLSEPSHELLARIGDQIHTDIRPLRDSPYPWRSRKVGCC